VLRHGSSNNKGIIPEKWAYFTLGTTVPSVPGITPGL